MSAEEVVKVLKQAVQNITFKKPIIHHSDRGDNIVLLSIKKYLL